MKLKIIISGGGTGGHIFPAIAIGKAIREQAPDAKILFVGALGKMEMEKVPAAGFDIVGLPVRGLNRSNMLKNISVVFKLLISLAKAKLLVLKFWPNAVIGVGGYAAGPVLFMSSLLGRPVFLQEQNSYAGVTNKIMAKRAKRIYVAYDKMEQFFPANKIQLTGNPIRQNLNSSLSKAEALNTFGLKPEVPTILLLGGSLGARTLNRSVIASLSKLGNENVQLIWQTGKNYITEAEAALQGKNLPNVLTTAFITEMDKAYAAADVVISRAGAGTISELCALGLPTVLVPSPNVAEDHQTKNAMALAEKQAAIMITDKEAIDKLIDTTLDLVKDQTKQQELKTNISKLARPNADSDIARDILSRISKKHQ